jgi:acyl-coenzyme A synthetase/AMP-(fatty) acid ligase
LPPDPAAWPATPNGTVPIGEIYPHLDWRVRADGELLVRGPQRFDGYLEASQDANRFYDDADEPLSAPGRGTLSAHAWYATGDRVVMHQGALVHLGRGDRQVQVRGFRIELAEVEHALRRLPHIRAAFATTSAMRGRLRLVAAVETSEEYTSASVLRALRKLVPPHLLPEQVVILSRFPLNPNGKVDGRRLTELFG